MTFNSYLNSMSGEKVFPVIQQFSCLAILLYLQMDVKTHILEGTPDQNTHMFYSVNANFLTQ